MNARIGLAAGALAVAGLVITLVIKTRESPDNQASASPPGGEETASEAGAQPRRMEATAAIDASPLPSADEVAEAKARVESEHERSPSHAPEILDNNLKSKPMRDARKAMQKGDYETALARAEDALAVEPDSNTARVVAVMAACSMSNRAVAQAHADKLDDMRKSRVAVRCQKFGIVIKGATPLPPDQMPGGESPP